MVAAVPLTDEPVLLDEEAYTELGDTYEIIDGELAERMPMATYSVIVRDNVYDMLKALAKERQTGFVFNDGIIYLMFKRERGIKGAYIPDVSFIRKDRAVEGWSMTTHYPGAPDLAIEVVSPNDDADKLQTKIRGYLERGTEQVWVVFPETREILVYRRDQPDLVRAYRGDSTIDAGDFFPGITLALADIFYLPSME